METTQVKTNSKAFKTAFNEHVISAVYAQDDVQSMDLAGALAYTVDRFNNEFGGEYEKKRWPNTQERFGEWLAGGAIGTFMWDDDIREFLNSLGSARPNATNTQAYTFYHRKFYMQFVELCKANGVKF